MAEQPKTHPSFGRGASWTLLSQAITFLTAAAASILLGRILGPGGKGMVSLINLVVMIMFLVGGLGIPLANTYLTGRGRFSVGELIGNSSLASFTVGPVVFVLMVVAYPGLYQNVLRHVGLRYLLLAGASIPLVILANNLYAILWGQQKFRFAAIINMAMRTADFILLVILLVVFRLGVWGAVLAMVARPVFGLATYLWALRERPRALLPRYQPAVAKESVGYGLRVQLGQVIEFFNLRLDLFLVNYLTLGGKVEVGLYGTAVAVAEMLWYLPNALGSMLLARTAASAEQEASRFTPVVCRQALMLMVLAAVPLYFIGSVLIPRLYGKSFAGSVPPLALLLPGVVALGLAKVLSTDLAGRGHPEYVSYVSGGALAVTLVLDFLLIPLPGYYGGIHGAAIASSIAYGCAALAVLICFLRVSGASLSETILPRRSDLAIYRRLVGELLRRPVSPPTLGPEGPSC